MSTAPKWRKSRRSAQANNCVEVATNLRDAALVRDTKDREGGTLTFGHTAWSSFTAAIKDGHLNG